MDGTRRSSFGFGSRSVAGIFESERRLFVAVTLALGCLALLLLPFLRARLGIDDALGGRPHDGYVEIARNLASGHGFVFEPGGAPVFHRPPLYPALIAPLMLLPESWHRPLVTLLDVLLAAITAVLTFRLGTHAFDRRVGVLATALTVGNPWLIAKLGVGMLPILQTFLFTALLVAISATLGIGRAGGEPPGAPRSTLTIGLLGAALALTHGGMLFTVLVLWIGWSVALLAQRARRHAVAVVGGSLCLIVAGIAPWTVRNHSVTGRAIPVAGNAGFAYFLSKVHWGEIEASEAEPSQEGVFGHAAAMATLRAVGVDGEDHYHFYGLKDPALDARLSDEMVEDILAMPLPFARRILLNALEYVAPISWPILMRGDQPLLEPLLRWKSKLARSLAFAALIALAAAGIARAVPADRRWRAVWLLFGVCAFAAPYALVYAARSDYSLGLVPTLSLLAALGVFARAPEAGPPLRR